MAQGQAPGLAPIIDWARASDGSYYGPTGYMLIATTDAVRWDYDPLTNALRGALIEPSRTNRMLRSEEFQTTWTADTATVTPDQAVAPDGETTADQLTDDGVGAELRQNTTGVTPTTKSALSCFFAEAGGFVPGPAVRITDNNALSSYVQASLDMGAGTVTASTGGNGVADESGVEELPDGWWRPWVSGVPNTSGTTTRVRLFAGVNDTESIHLWGAQLEAGSFPTSYIETEGAAVARSADKPDVSLADFLGDHMTAFTVVMRLNQYEGWSDGSSRYLFTFHDGTANNVIYIRSLNGRLRATTVVGGSGGGAELFNVPGNYDDGAEHLVVLVVDDGGTARLVIDGTQVASATWDIAAGTMDTLNIGFSQAGASNIAAWVKDFKIIPRALTQAEAEALQ